MSKSVLTLFRAIRLNTSGSRNVITLRYTGTEETNLSFYIWTVNVTNFLGHILSFLVIQKCDIFPIRVSRSGSLSRILNSRWHFAYNFISINHASSAAAPANLDGGFDMKTRQGEKVLEGEVTRTSRIRWQRISRKIEKHVKLLPDFAFFSPPRWRMNELKINQVEINFSTPLINRLAESSPINSNHVQLRCEKNSKIYSPLPVIALYDNRSAENNTAT